MRLIVFVIKNKTMKEFFNWKGILTGVVSSLIATGIFWFLTEKLLWCLSLPLWIWLIVTLFIANVFFMVCFIVRKHRISHAISEYKEGTFGDSYEYTWEYRKGNGPLSVYGYEPYQIRTKRLLAELNNEHTITLGHEVSEENIKRIIQITIICMVDIKMKDILQPTLEYLHYLEDSRYHKL